MKLDQLITRNAIHLPEKTATIFNGRQHNWGQLKDRVARMAGALKTLGLKSGDRVSVLALNSDYYLETYYSVIWADGVIVPLNTRWSVAENINAIEDSAAHFLMIDDNFLDYSTEIMAQTSLIDTVIYMGEGKTPLGMHNYEQLIEHAVAVEPGERGDDDLAGIFYTGGTTGSPKGVMLSHNNLMYSAMYCLVSTQFATNPDICLHAAPMFHLADVGATIVAIFRGTTHCFVPTFDPLQVLKTIAAQKVNALALVPTMAQMIFDHPEFENFNISSLKCFSYGASPMPLALIERIMHTLPSAQFNQGYGQTEMGPIITILRPEDHHIEGPYSHRRSSVGRPAIGVDVKIVDDNLNEMPSGETGQIIARGKNAMLGYLNKPEQTAETIIDGWVLTGDAGYFDEDGFLYLVDRIKDMIITGGENVFSVEVENALGSHPDVQSVAVIGIPSKEWGEAVHAIVILISGSKPTEADLIAHCKKRIAGYKCPKSISFRTEPLPLSGAGKVMKTELRKPYWKDQNKRRQ